MAKIAPISEELLRNICKVIADTGMGLTGAEIGHILLIPAFPILIPISQNGSGYLMLVCHRLHIESKNGKVPGNFY